MAIAANAQPVRIATEGLYAPFRLRDKFNGALAAMKDDGSLNALIRKHFGEDATGF